MHRSNRIGNSTATHGLAVVILLLLILLPSFAVAQAAPLLQPGKKAIYQRVLTRPGAELATKPGEDQRTLVNAFSRFYVYDRQGHAGIDWLQVGTDTRGQEIQGWIRADRTVPWKQQLTLAFTNSGAKRDRLLFFRSRDELLRIFESPEPGMLGTPLTEKMVQGGRDERIVAIEPETFVDINAQFYLLPILDHRIIAASSGDRVRILKVASVTKQALPSPGTSAAQSSAANTPQATAQEQKKQADIQGFMALRSFKAAVVFVIDSTISMKRYIAETKAAVARVYDRMKEAELLDLASFGLVAYRAPSADPERGSRLEYIAKEFVDPSDVQDGTDFLARVKSLSEAPVTTDQFDEDAYAGVMEALEGIRWSDFGARYIVLVSDAGALEGEASTTGMDAERLRSLASEQGIAIYVLHLRTPIGRAGHAQAKKQYLRLSENAAVQESLYFPVATDSSNHLGQAIDTLSESIIDNIRQASLGEAVAGSVTTATGLSSKKPSTKPLEPKSTPENTNGSDTDGTDLDRLRAITNALGHAMQLAYLGKVEKTLAPTLFDAWISDRDFTDPTKRMVDVRVLLTKNQLSDLQMILQQVVHAAETGMLEPDRFFESLRSLALQFGRDPNLARRPQATRLADLGLLGEYLEDLPYQSDVMGIDQDTWSRWGPQRQLDFTSRLKAKIRLYERYNADWRRWINLAQTSAAGPGEWVYPVPLSDLP